MDNSLEFPSYLSIALSRLGSSRAASIEVMRQPLEEGPANQMRACCPLDEAALRLLASRSVKRQFSVRALDRIARVVRTIADLAHGADIHAEHVAEAIQYRSLERLDGRAA